MRAKLPVMRPNASMPRGPNRNSSARGTTVALGHLVDRHDAGNALPSVAHALHMDDQTPASDSAICCTMTSRPKSALA